MKKILIILLGLLLIGILTYFCFQDKIGTIRENLETNANSILMSNNLTDAKAGLIGNGFETTTIMKLTGNAPSVESKEEVGRLVAAVGGVSSVDNQLLVARQELVSIPEDIEEIQPISIPEPELEPEPEEEPKQAVVEVPSPYLFDAFKDKNGHLTLDGYVDNEDAHMDLIAQASELFGSKNITDNLKIAKGAPQNWEKVIQYNVSKLKDVDSGNIKLHDVNYAFNGFISSDEAQKLKISILSDAKSTMEQYSNYSGNFEITTPAPKEKEVIAQEPKLKDSKLCQKELITLASRQKILFEYNKADIKKDDTTALDSVVKILKECKFNEKEILEIGGHTDSIGNAPYNQKLSQQRANSVKDYIIKQGIDKSKLITHGYGEKKPMVSNMLKSGRAKNRRIEFKIKEVK